MFNLDIYKNNVAAIDIDGNQLFYKDILEYQTLFNENIKSKSLIFNLCSNNFGALVGYVSLVNCKQVQFMVDKDIDLKSLLNYLNTYKPQYLWLPNDKLENLKDKLSLEVCFSKLSYSLVKLNSNHNYPLYSELALLITTSGSTGSPKLVRQSFKNIETNTKSIIKYLEITQNDRAISVLPMNYTFGLSVINTHIYSGATMLLTDSSIMQKEFWSFLKDYKATSFSGVPYTYQMLYRLMFTRRELPDLKVMTQAGGKLSVDLQQVFATYCKDNNKRFYVMYGQSEATARMSYLPYEKSLEKLGSIGIPVDGGCFSIVDENGIDITTPNTSGELLYKGDNVSLGYASCIDDLQKEDENNGVLHTGDIAQFDEDGYYYIVGRKKRFLKIFGNRVGLDETESLITQAFKNLECACTGVDDKMKVYITDESLIKDVKEYLTTKTHLNHTAFSVISIDSIPKNKFGKVLYSELV